MLKRCASYIDASGLIQLGLGDVHGDVFVI
jgi:hypothetical protein